MTYAIVDIVWAKSHGIEILPEMRTSVDQSKVILHEEMLLPLVTKIFRDIRLAIRNFLIFYQATDGLIRKEKNL